MSSEPILQRQIGPLSRTDLVRYAGAGGDFNPIHHDEPFARGAGYPSVIAHGLLTAGLTGTVLAEHVGPVQLRRYAVRYTGPVLPGDVLSITATESGEQGVERGRRRIDIQVEATGDDGTSRTVLTAEAEVDR